MVCERVIQTVFVPRARWSGSMALARLLPETGNHPPCWTPLSRTVLGQVIKVMVASRSIRARVIRPPPIQPKT